MADLQRRLAETGLSVGLDEPAVYGAGTRAAVEAFQHRRGLRVDGVCGRQTWGALVEAGFRIGDRFLYLRNPMLRGDDVADLQYKLAALGFDSGRVDGILGEQTSAAIREFQRNAGLPVDAILGAATLRELKRVMPREAGGELVSTVRDLERLRHAPTTLHGRKIAVGEEGGLDAVVAAVRRRLTGAGALVVPLVHPIGSVQAANANAAGVEVYIGLRLDAVDARSAAAYYGSYNYESEGGRRLAELLHKLVAGALEVPAVGTEAMSVPVLRETRMPAVICEFGAATDVVRRTGPLADAIVAGLTTWMTTPLA